MFCSVSLCFGELLCSPHPFLSSFFVVCGWLGEAILRSLPLWEKRVTPPHPQPQPPPPAPYSETQKETNTAVSATDTSQCNSTRLVSVSQKEIDKRVIIDAQRHIQTHRPSLSFSYLINCISHFLSLIGVFHLS